MSYSILDKIKSTDDLKSLPRDELEPLCSELRSFLIESASQSGGHLASNLGVVELSVALHRVFDSPRDHIIFDVGHQAYVHKILTGRRERFFTIRKPGGLSGFTSRRESEHDAFGAGHSSTALSASLGFAESDKLRENDNYTVCVIGDGAYTGGMVHEAINNCKPDLRLIIILNENGMSISKTKGSFASYLSRVRASRKYRSVKSGTSSFLGHVPVLGRPIKWLLSLVKRGLKRIFFTTNYFEDLGFYYLGPIDGNDYKRVEQALNDAKRLEKCVFVHLKTKKGKGLLAAENSPESYHSISGASSGKSFHEVAAEELVSLAEQDDSIVAITPAMGIGTGLSDFENRFGDRYFDVGIAEEHALTFSAGLAAGGMNPFVAIYSTFLQRGYDNILHDIALQALPVRLLIDRAGISVADGATHHGIFDVSFLSHIPGIEIISPSTLNSLRAAVRYAASAPHPIAVRYPNSTESDTVAERFYYDGNYDGFGLRTDFDTSSPPKNIFVTYGGLCANVIIAQQLLSDAGVECGIVLAERIKPYEPLCDLLERLIQNGCRIVFAEEGIKNGGAAMIVCEILSERVDLSVDDYRIAAINDDFLIPDKLCDIFDYAGLSPRRLADYFIT